MYVLLRAIRSYQVQQKWLYYEIYKEIWHVLALGFRTHLLRPELKNCNNKEHFQALLSWCCSSICHSLVYKFQCPSVSFCCLSVCPSPGNPASRWTRQDRTGQDRTGQDRTYYQLVILNWGLGFLGLGIGDLNSQSLILKTPIPNLKSPFGNFITNWWFSLLVLY